MAGDDATNEGKVQVVGRSREMRLRNTELYEEIRAAIDRDITHQRRMESGDGQF